MGIDALGYEEDQKELYMNALKQPQGMILVTGPTRSEEHTSELQSRRKLVCRLLLEKKKTQV